METPVGSEYIWESIWSDLPLEEKISVTKDLCYVGEKAAISLYAF